MRGVMACAFVMVACLGFVAFDAGTADAKPRVGQRAAARRAFKRGFNAGQQAEAQRQAAIQQQRLARQLRANGHGVTHGFGAAAVSSGRFVTFVDEHGRVRTVFVPD
jgi:hypothetical protein